MYEEGMDFESALLADAELSKYLSRDEILRCFSEQHHLRNIDAIFERVFGATRLTGGHA
jgi:adenylosuccinate lyase